jgi:hypothetical protein
MSAWRLLLESSAPAESGSSSRAAMKCIIMGVWAAILVVIFVTVFVLDQLSVRIREKKSWLLVDVF